MSADKRTADRKDIDAMTREFLSKGGKIVQCPPGPSETVVYKHGSFRRRRPAASEGEAAAAPPPADEAGEPAAAPPAERDSTEGA